MQVIIDTWGTHVGSRDGMLHIRLKDGTSETLPPRKVRSIIVHRGVNLTSDVLMLALQHDISIIFTDKIGRPLGYLWNGKFGSIATIRKNQLVFADGGNRAKLAVPEVAQRPANFIGKNYADVVLQRQHQHV